jgi:Flp pilus assembly protein TadD
MGDCYSKAYARWIALPDNASDHLVPNELGFYLLENGSYVSAEAFLVAALNARAQVEGPEDPSTLVSMNNLATLLWKKGDYAGAELLYRRALEVSERVLGEDDPNMLDPMNNLAVMLDEKGDQAGAEPLCRRALEGCKRILGPEHPRTLLSMNNLAVSLTRKGNYAEAEELCRQALEVSEWVLGPDDPTTLTIAYGLGFLLDQKGDDTEAEPLYRRALEAMERVLGPEHPDTLSTTQAVADFFDKVGKAEEGLSLRLKRIKLLSEDPNAEPLILRTAALDSYRLGNHTLATVFLRRILEAGFELPGTHCHLARVLLLSDEIDTARHEIAQAWQHRADAPPYVLPRILFFQLLFAFLDHADSGTTLNRLKHALAQEGAHMEWMIQPVLEHLRPRLSPGDMALLQAVSAAIDSEKNMDLLEDSGEDEH